MMRHLKKFRGVLLGIGLSVLCTPPLFGQRLLDQKISIVVQDRPLGYVLDTIGHQGNFYFSYNSSLLPADSLVSVTARGKSVEDLLSSLLGPGYLLRETAHYVIIRKYAPDGKPFLVSGYVTDKKTGDKIAHASIYEAEQFASTLSDDQGYFQLRLHNRSPEISLRISKIGFNDTAYQLPSVDRKQLILSVSPIRTISLKPVTITPNQGIGKSWLGKWLLSSRQKISDVNISRFFVRQPFQYSVWPGLGTHGKLSAQVVNKFSFNIFGGYSAGVNGFELGGLFNIDKNDVQYTQIAGLFNTVGGTMTGVQVAGLHNSVLDSVYGVQIGGLSNTTRQNVRGVQVAGIVNQAKSVTGIQITGIANISRGTVHGLQVAGLLNQARKVEGWQIGLVNIADTSSGYSIGLVNVIKHHGYYKLSLFWNEAPGLNLAIKTGSKRWYNMLLAGVSPDQKDKVFSLGYGIGKELSFGQTLSLTTELTEQNFFVGYDHDVPVLVRLQPSLQLHLSKKIALFAGPSFSMYLSGSSQPTSGKEDPVPPKAHFTLWRSTMGWLGGQVGITFL